MRPRSSSRGWCCPARLLPLSPLLPVLPSQSLIAPEVSWILQASPLKPITASSSSSATSVSGKVCSSIVENFSSLIPQLQGAASTGRYGNWRTHACYVYARAEHQPAAFKLIYPFANVGRASFLFFSFILEI